MAGNTRDRMVDAAVAALRADGVAGMSFTDVLRDSGAARGAIYHHFPGGKAQLVGEAATRNAEDVRAHLSALPASTPHAVVQAFLAAVRPVVAASTTGGGCPVAAITVGSDAGTQPLRQIAAGAFTAWSDALAERLRAAGVPPDDAADLATSLITLLEGAHVLCRAAGDLEPFERAARATTTLVTTRYPDK